MIDIICAMFILRITWFLFVSRLNLVRSGNVIILSIIRLMFAILIDSFICIDLWSNFIYCYWLIDRSVIF